MLHLLQSGLQVFIVQASVSPRSEQSRTNYNCSIPVTQQFSDKLKINPGRNKSATFRRQSLYLDNCFGFKFSIKTFRFDDLINVIFRFVDVIILTASRRGQGIKIQEVQHATPRVQIIINHPHGTKKSILKSFLGLGRN